MLISGCEWCILIVDEMLNTSLWAYCLRTTLEEKIDYIEIRKSQIMKREPQYGTCTIRLISLLSEKKLFET